MDKYTNLIGTYLHENINFALPVSKRIYKAHKTAFKGLPV